MKLAAPVRHGRAPARLARPFRAGATSRMHWKSESGRLWRLLGGPVSASLPNSLELTPARCSGSAALSSRTRSRCEAGQTVAAADRFRTIQVYPKDLRALPGNPEPAVSWLSGFRGGAHARPRTTPVHDAARGRRSGGVAVRGAGAAD